MSARDMEYGAKVLIANKNWQEASLLTSALATLFGQRERIEHMGWQATICWWRDVPYLVRIAEPQP